MISEILSGKRKLNRTQIGKLAWHFHVAPGAFLAGVPFIEKVYRVGRSSHSTAGALEPSFIYDDSWEFKTLEIELQQINGATVTVVTTQSYTTETGMANPGIFSVTFNNVVEPPAGQSYSVTVRLTLKKTGQVDKRFIDSKQLTIPAKPNGGGPVGGD